MGFSIEGFKGNFRGGGARPTHYEVQLISLLNFITTPTEKLRFTCKAASLPPSMVNPIPVRYFGREIKFQGDRMFPEWTLTVLNDEDFLVRNALEAWMGRMNGHETNLNKYGNADPALYKADAVINQFGKVGNIIKSYRFIGIWPSNIGDITMSYDATDQIEEYSVTLQYDYWLVDPIGTSPGDIVSVL